MVLGLAGSSLEGEVGAGEGPFRVDHQAGVRGALSPLGPAPGALAQHQWEGCDIFILQETSPSPRLFTYWNFVWYRAIYNLVHPLKYFCLFLRI